MKSGTCVSSPSEKKCVGSTEPHPACCIVPIEGRAVDPNREVDHWFTLPRKLQFSIIFSSSTLSCPPSGNTVHRVYPCRPGGTRQRSSSRTRWTASATASASASGSAFCSTEFPSLFCTAIGRGGKEATRRGICCVDVLGFWSACACILRGGTVFQCRCRRRGEKVVQCRWSFDNRPTQKFFVKPRKCKKNLEGI